MASEANASDVVTQVAARFELRAWQTEALAEWVDRSRQGVIEAVTGAGKTRLGLAAIQLALEGGYDALVIVPTVELMNQWTAELSRNFGSATVARLGDGYKEWFDARHSIVVGVAPSVARKNVLEQQLHGSRATKRLLVADEVHRYAADSWSKGLTPNYTMRLGLTATYERADYKHEEVLDEYFGGIIYELWYDRALADEIIANFDIALVSVRLEIGEQGRYDKAMDEFRDAHNKLSKYVNFKKPWHIVDREITELAGLDDSSAECRYARRYQAASRQRKTIAADATAKQKVLRSISHTYAGAKRTIIFTMTQNGAREAAENAATVESPALAVYSDMDEDERLHALRAFKNGSVDSIAAPRILDEGVDVPEADLGIILAMNRSKRQFVQRLGRIIRLKKDGRRAQLVVIYAHGTVEDPYRGDNGDRHLRKVLPFAWRFGRFSFEHQERNLLEFLDLTRPEKRLRDNQHSAESVNRATLASKKKRVKNTTPSPSVNVDRKSTRGETRKSTTASAKLHPSAAADAIAAAILQGKLTAGARLLCIAGDGAARRCVLRGTLRPDGRLLHDGHRVESLERAARAATGERLSSADAFSLWCLEDGTRLVDIVSDRPVVTELKLQDSVGTIDEDVQNAPPASPQSRGVEININWRSLLRWLIQLEYVDRGDRLEALDTSENVLAGGEINKFGKILVGDEQRSISLEEFVINVFGGDSSEFAKHLRILGGPTLADLARAIHEEQSMPSMPKHQSFVKPQPTKRRNKKQKAPRSPWD